MFKLLFAIVLAVLAPSSALAAPSTQTLHAFLCAPEPAAGSGAHRN